MQETFRVELNNGALVVMSFERNVYISFDSQAIECSIKLNHRQTKQLAGALSNIIKKRETNNEENQS